jgi:hypothetical protein
MSSRKERLAANEVRFREINEGAEPLQKAEGPGRFVCECSNRSCISWVELTPSEYRHVRENPRHFFVWPGHEEPDVETVLEQHERYWIVEKPDDVAHIVE